ncbi:transposase [Spirosoma soli]|uniref:Transposase n=1 Tax=Spirosoma soli TaxID=1770529 RepID=A0ABW5LWR6_9BACT
MLGLTWAPRGQTPILQQQAGRDHLSLIAAIAPNGRIYLAGQDRSFTGEDIAWFLSKLCGRYRKRDLLIVWDGAPIHRGEAVKAFLSERPGRVHLECLPAYSPDRTAEAAKPDRTGLESAQGRAKEPGISLFDRLNSGRD